MKPRSFKLKTAAVVVVLSCLIYDLSARVIFHNPFFHSEGRALFLSGASPVNRDTFVAFEPGHPVHEIALFRSPLGEYHIEYDCTYHTDEFGFVENQKENRQGIVLLGDSFTYGEGGCSWIQNLRQAWGEKIYNAGMSGTGVRHWQGIQKFIGARFSVARYVMIFVEEDFYRLPWQWSDHQLSCLKSGLNCDGEIVYPFTNPSQLVELAKKREQFLSQWESIQYFVNTYLWPESMILSPATHGFLLAPQSRSYEDSIRPEHLGPSLAALREILKVSPDMEFVHVNQRDEAAMGIWNSRSRDVEQSLKEMGVVSHSCWLDYRDFLPLDAHPSVDGYLKLEKCVAGLDLSNLAK